MAFTVEAGGRTLGLLVLLLALGVAVRDAPEISSLLDDYSNDGVIECCQGSVRQTASSQRSKQETLSLTATRFLARMHLRQRRACVPSFVLPSATGKGRLRFLSILRD